MSAPTGVADVTSGVIFGNGLAIDGDLLATVSRWVNTPSTTAGQPDGNGGYVQLHRLTTPWQPEDEVAAVPVPPPGCLFPCFAFGVEARSIDRTK